MLSTKWYKTKTLPNKYRVVSYGSDPPSPMLLCEVQPKQQLKRADVWYITIQNSENEIPNKADDLSPTEYYDKTEIQGDICTRVDKMSLAFPLQRTR